MTSGWLSARHQFNGAVVLMQHFGHLRRDPGAGEEALTSCGLSTMTTMMRRLTMIMVVIYAVALAASAVYRVELTSTR
jgi:hypothetical protein